MKTRVLKSGIAALALAALSTPMTASASPDAIDIAGVRVSFADLNIHNDAGAQELYGRLKRATEVACQLETLTESGSIERLKESKACFDLTLNRSVDKLASPALKRIHRG